MVELKEVFETYEMVSHENLDVRTITMGISLLDCIDPDLDRLCDKIYDKITTLAKDLVRVGDEIGLEYGVPVINKRVSVTPVAIVGGAACDSPEDFVRIAQTLDRAAHTIGVNFIGGYSALVQKGMTRADRNLIESIPAALACTERVCSSISLGSTKTGINMDAVRLMGDIVVRTAEATKDADSIGCAKLVVFCNASGSTVHTAIVGEDRTLYHALNERMGTCHQAFDDVWGVNGGHGKVYASFDVYRGLEDAGRIRLQKSSAQPVATEGNPSYSLAGAEYAVCDDAGAQVATLVTDEAGAAGPTADLPSGTYTVRETKAPEGYNKLSERVEIAVKDANLEASVSNDTWQSGGVHVVNHTGSLLPTTGGMGTTIFYVAGGAIVIAAAATLVYRKRMGK